ncbi:MAG TPA: ornithine cyclodeaminase family protein [bacterium]|nr:ornithine cyclodeaminase family protein [bacterium]
MPLILTNEEVAQVLSMDLCLEAMERAFRSLGEGRAVNRPRSHTYLPTDRPDTHYLFKSMEGAIPESRVMALRVTSEKIQQAFHDGIKRRETLPNSKGKWVGLVLLFSLETCELLAVMPDGYLQKMRVGATSALAAKILSRPDSRIAGLLGTGWQAGAQVEGLLKVRPITEIKVYSPTRDHLLEFCRRWSERLRIPLHPMDGPQPVVEGSDIIVAATNALEPVFNGEWLTAGMHVNSVLSLEMDETTFARADLIAVRARETPTFFYPPGRGPTWGEEKPARSSLNPKIRELGKILTGAETGRRNSQEITLFVGSGQGLPASAGLGIQFAAAGAAVLKEAERLGLGRKIPADWFLESVHP